MPQNFRPDPNRDVVASPAAPERLALPHPLRIVLVEPQGPLNIGAVCRVMKNFGLADLVLVKPRCRIGTTARKFALHAQDLLATAPRVRSVGAAVGDCVLVLGTSNRTGPYHDPNLLPAEGLALIAERLRHGPVAVLFGREDFGLSQEDLTHCQGTIRIPTSPAFSSLNLAQAVALFCYEAWQALAPLAFAPPPARPGPLMQPASEAELDRLYAHMFKVLTTCEFLLHNNPDRTLQVLRTVFGRMGLSKREIRVLMGMFSNIEGYMRIHADCDKTRRHQERRGQAAVALRPRRRRAPAPAAGND